MEDSLVWALSGAAGLLACAFVIKYIFHSPHNQNQRSSRFQGKIATLQEMFPRATLQSLEAALASTNGSIEEAIEILTASTSQSLPSPLPTAPPPQSASSLGFRSVEGHSSELSNCGWSEDPRERQAILVAKKRMLLEQAQKKRIGSNVKNE